MLERKHTEQHTCAPRCAQESKKQQRNLEESFSEVYTKFKLQLYRTILQRLGNREASLSTVETFCIDVIAAMGTPTISEFADFVKISQANATYKVQSLEKKGYLIKERSQADKREWLLKVSQRYCDYARPNRDYVATVVRRLEECLNPEQLQQMQANLGLIADELMPEVPIPSFGCSD